MICTVCILDIPKETRNAKYLNENNYSARGFSYKEIEEYIAYSKMRRKGIIGNI